MAAAAERCVAGAGRFVAGAGRFVAGAGRFVAGAGMSPASVEIENSQEGECGRCELEKKNQE